MAGAVQRIAVQTTLQDTKAITAKAKKLAIAISELMRRGAFACDSSQSDSELAALADASKGAADRARAAIDAALDFIRASNERIAKMEANARRASTAAGRKVARWASPKRSGAPWRL